MITKIKDVVTLAKGLDFPEGPIALPDGEVILVELFAGSLTRIDYSAHVKVITNLGGAPNGANRPDAV